MHSRKWQYIKGFIDTPSRRFCSSFFSHITQISLPFSKFFRTKLASLASKLRIIRSALVSIKQTYQDPLIHMNRRLCGESRGTPPKYMLSLSLQLFYQKMRIKACKPKKPQNRRGGEKGVSKDSTRTSGKLYCSINNDFEITIISRNRLIMILSIGTSKLNLPVILSLARGY